jgi:hydrogenase expression/formation protein HypC
MCLAVPGRITELRGRIAVVNIEGVTRKADVSLVPDAEVGDYVIVHAGFAIEKYDEEQAKESLRLLREMLNASSE